MKKRILALFTCLALCLSLLPTAALAQGGNTLTVGGDGTGADYKYFTEALNNANNGDTITLLGNAGAFVPEGQGNDIPLVIDKQLTINGNGHTLTVWYAGILLGADVTFDNLTINLSNAFSNAIYANGHRLTLNQVRNEQATGATANVIHLFSGGAMNAGWDGRANGGSHGQIIIRGSNNRLGDIFAGNWSYTDTSSTYSGPSTITVEESAGGTIGNIYACGAYEPTGTGNSNDILPNSDKFPVTGEVTINLSNGAVGTVYGETGGSSNAKVVYDSSISYSRGSRLEDVASLEVKRGYFAPGKANTLDTLDGVAITLASGARLDLRNVSSPIAPASWSGDGGVLEIGKDQALYIMGSVTGSTKVAIGGLWGTELAQEAATADHLYIQAGQAQGGEFTFLPKTAGGTAPEWSAADKGWQLASSGSGGGTTPTGPVKPSSFRFMDTTISKTLAELQQDLYVEARIECPIPEDSYLGEVKFTIQIQKDQGNLVTAYRDYGQYGYTYTSTVMGFSEIYATIGDDPDQAIFAITPASTITPGSYTFTVSVDIENGTTATDTLTLNITDSSTPP